MARDIGGGYEAHGRNNQHQSFIYPILNRRNSSINSTNQFNTESSVGNLESVQPEQQIVQTLSINLAQQIIFVNYLSRQLDAAGGKKKTPLGQEEAWREAWNIFSGSRCDENTFVEYGRKKICLQGTMISVHHGS